jgi:hypothetical protein
MALLCGKLCLARLDCDSVVEIGYEARNSRSVLGEDVSNRMRDKVYPCGAGHTVYSRF